MKIKIKKTHQDGITPTYGSEGAACFDLYAIEGGTILSGESVTFDTGIAFEIPVGHYMAVFSRSGMGFKNNVRLSNSVGAIDNDYRNTVKVSLYNDGRQNYLVRKGDRIAQAMIRPVEHVEFEEGELSETARGTQGIGSTGK